MSELRNYLTVTELNTYLKNIITEDSLLHNVKIIGEVSSYSTSGNNSYFTIKDDFSCLNVCCFSYFKKAFAPTNGDSIMISGNPDYYIKSGKMSFIADKIEPYGVGNLFLNLEKLKEKLKLEGLFDEKYKKPIPKFPKTICVITSFSGAVIQDIITTIRKKNNFIDILVYDVRVQGENAAVGITEAVKKVDTQNFDCIILARGGGSAEDLAPFNDEGLARAIFKCNTPFISAIGHETDFSISDFVADIRALTPTNAGDIVAYDEIELKEHISNLIVGIQTSVSYKIEDCQHRIKLLSKNIMYKCEKNIDKIINRLGILNRKVLQKITTDILRKDLKLKFFIETLDTKNPIRLLSKGYFRLKSGDKVIKSIDNLKVNDTINFRDTKKVVNAKIINIEDINE